MKFMWTKQAMAVFFIAIHTLACDPMTQDSAISTNGEGVILPDGTAFSRTALLEAFGACIVSEIENFEEQSHAFAATITAANSDPDQREEAQRAWRATIDGWQQLEVMQVGPAGRKTQPGGKGIRDSLYAWPLDNSCAIDSYLVSEVYTSSPDEVRFNANGLSASEYLLFYEGRENACGPDELINSDGLWNDLNDDDLTARRAAYAELTAMTVVDAASSLFEAWSPTGGNFLAELTQAGNGSRTYGKQRIALNAVSDAIFYVEWATKDRKLARPLGMILCDDELCLDQVESPYSRHSLSNLKNNLRGFRKIFLGCGIDNAGLGFDDFLYAVGESDLAIQIDQASQATIDAIDAIDEVDLVTALTEDKQSVLNVHSAIKSLTDLLRTDFLLVLSLELPHMVQGDND